MNSCLDHTLCTESFTKPHTLIHSSTGLLFKINPNMASLLEKDVDSGQARDMGRGSSEGHYSNDGV